MGQTSRPGRVLGLDLGDARIGVAISDDDRRIAVPLGTVHTGAPADLKAIAALVEEHAATLVVVGLPLSMSGERGPAAAQGRRRSPDALRSFLAVPVELQDERLSTVEAERGLRDAGVTGTGAAARGRSDRGDRHPPGVAGRARADHGRSSGASRWVSCQPVEQEQPRRSDRHDDPGGRSRRGALLVPAGRLPADRRRRGRRGRLLRSLQGRQRAERRRGVHRGARDVGGGGRLAAARPRCPAVRRVRGADPAAEHRQGRPDPSGQLHPDART